MRGRSRAETFGLGAGVAAIVLLIAGFFAIDERGTTPLDGSKMALVDEMVRAPTRARIGVVVGLLGAGLLVWFGAALRDRLSETRARGGSVLGSVAYGFAVVAAIGGFAHGALRLSVTSVGDREVLSEAIRALAILDPIPMTVLTLGIIALVVTMSVAAWVAGVLNRGMATVGLVLAVGAIAFLATDRGGPGLVAMLWVAVAAAMLAAARPAEL